MAARPWTVAGDGVVLTVRLTPRGGRDSIDGIQRLADGSTVIAARVRAPASEGEANAALVRLMAKALGIPALDVVLRAGETSRIKRLKIAGDPASLAATLSKICPLG